MKAKAFITEITYEYNPNSQIIHTMNGGLFQIPGHPTSKIRLTLQGDSQDIAALIDGLEAGAAISGIELEGEIPKEIMPPPPINQPRIVASNSVKCSSCKEESKFAENHHLGLCYECASK